VFDRIAAGRGSVRGPFTVLVHDPPLADAVMALGAVARDPAVLAPAESELAILTTASERKVAYIWSAHEPSAVRAGTRTEAIRAAQSGSSTDGLTAREAVIVEYARAVVRDSRVPEALFDRAVAELGRPAVIRLAALVGFYMLIGSVLMTFDIQPVAQPAAGG
jgi:4-carboxymuconolactone decarboxylase